MEIHIGEDEEQYFGLYFERSEVPILKALLQRASYVDPNPDWEQLAVEMAEAILEHLPDKS